MKIIKITLQNINSLKSETPIVIDFESDHFQDVGLFAITGSTGAGKTTILDAITIAMYHQVPRFNASNVKAGLVDVVSYGADEAYSSVVFENNGVKYEAHWSMRLVTKGGKKLTNPQEEVRLKDISSGKIIAEKKREVQTEVERVTQLDYNQFLRSVMLAQGEFASFLSAKGSEKAKLLEQITGEQIYKKIGEVILSKRSQEDKKLTSIKSSVNTEDVLSPEQQEILKTEEVKITKDLKKLSIVLSQIEEILTWYQKSDALVIAEQKLTTQQEEFASHKLTHQPDLDRLERNELAEPFKENLQRLKHSEEELIKQEQEIKLLETALNELSPAIQKAVKEVSVSSEELKFKDLVLKEWLPKLEKISQLDTQILGEKKVEEKLKESLASIDLNLVNLKRTLAEALGIQEKKENEILQLNTFLDTHIFIPKIEAKIIKWSTDLTKLQTLKEGKAKEELYCKTKQAELLYARRAFKSQTDLIAQEDHKLLEVNSVLEQVVAQMKTKDSAVLNAKKETLTQEHHLWQQLQTYSDAYLKNADQKAKLETENSKALTDQSRLVIERDRLANEIKQAKLAVADGEKIVGLEQAIKEFSEERKKLEEGKPCNLCGAISHPYVDHYQDIDESTSDKELSKRKQKLEDFQHQQLDTEKQLAGIEGQLINFAKRLQELSIDITSLEEKSKVLDLNYNLDKSDEAKERLAELTVIIKSVEDEITKAQKLQSDKERMDSAVILIKEQLSLSKQELSKLEEKGKNIAQEVDGKRKIIEQLEVESIGLEGALEKDLAKFKYTVPTPELTAKFILQIETQITEYNKKVKQKGDVLAKIAANQVELKITNNQIKEKTVEFKEVEKSLKQAHSDMLELSKKRNGLLSSQVTVEFKRNELGQEIDRAKNKQALADKEVNKLRLEQQNTKSRKELTSKHNKEEQVTLSSVLDGFQKQLAKSAFANREEVMGDLLDLDIKKAFLQIKEHIQNKSVELTTLVAKLAEEKASLASRKTFEKQKVDAELEQSDTLKAKEELIKRSGEIAQQFQTDERIRARNTDIFDQITAQEKVVKKWSDLMVLLGGNQHAFNTYVQRLTLQNLIGFANIHLYKLNRRYALRMEETYKPGEELNFKLIDHYQTDQTRFVDTSSGGEKFLISLSLALGLSDLASNNVSIDSLFIDEGFGTLDNHTLETVISTLETLQARGKMIGIISHVENLKERIPTQIQVSKRSNGVSVVEVV